MQEKDFSVIDNFLELEYFKNLKEFIFSNKFGWFYVDSLSTYADNEYYHFQHLLYDNDKVNSEYFILFQPFLSKLNLKSLLRLRVNLSCNLNKKIECAYHVDQNFDHKTAILYFNTTDGKTVLKNDAQKEIEIDCIENRLLLMNKPILHKYHFCNDTKTRVVINLNYI